MPDLATALATPPPVRWVVGTVTAVGAATVTLTLDGGTVAGAGYLDQYVPVVGDVVHALAGPRGLLVLGSNNAPVVPPPPVPTPPAPVTVAANAMGTYQASTGTWSAGVLLQSPDSLAVFAYPVMTTIPGLITMPLGQVTLTLNRVSGGPPELGLHGMAVLAGAPVLLDDATYRVDLPTIGTTGTVNLPLEWGRKLTSGTARGIAIGRGLYTGDWSGSSGLLTFYPL